MRHLARTNLFYLLTAVLRRTDADHPWLYDRCREVQRDPDNHLDLWARGHYKSTIITFAKTIQDILCSYGQGATPPLCRTFGIFSHTRPIASAFCAQIKREFEANEVLRSLFPDICWENPKRDAPMWTNQGFILKGNSNPKEGTVEAWGLVESQPTSKHYDVRVYDDVVTQEAIGTPEQIKKATAAWELSLNLGSTQGVARYIGTKYHVHDTYKEIENRGGVKVRKYAATHDGKLDGQSVFLPPEVLQEKIRQMGTTTAACQLMQDPKAAEELGFKKEDLRYYEERPDPSIGEWNTYILIDPANTTGKKSDWTAIGVVCQGADLNYYVLELIRDKLSLSERAKTIMGLHRRYRPNAVGYEAYGMQADIEHLKSVMEREHYRFDITPLGGNKISKMQRIEQLGPLFEDHRIWLPRQQFRTLYDGTRVDMVEMFIREEFEAWPVTGKHEDCLDMLSRIADPDLNILPPEQSWVINLAGLTKQQQRDYSWIL